MKELLDLVKSGKAAESEARVQALLDRGREPEAILKAALVPAMDEVGRLFQEGVFFLPEMLVAATAMKRGLAVLRPHLVQAGVEPLGRAVAATVKGDIHDIGKNLVCMALEGGGFEVVDLGADVKPATIVEAVEAHRPDVLCMSALLTTTMIAMADVIEDLRRAGLRDSVSIIVGGGAVSRRFADEIGADGYGDDPVEGKELARAALVGDGDRVRDGAAPRRRG